ncbi:Rha family transcriptional regulator [Ligilactobacillus aviarius]|uniref:Uncharacterized protein n=1 Tax=Ligilactobacillus aviarius TaxID=1606 RepID=A0A510WQZ4_9LACO|nr:Rha family transcriptional regulator [Ligilactobacillus aviarius]KRM38565.1 hypothetical protein FC33_GL000065 [Ligilactobacillus aviarius subsp. aviarius DSM 20655]GEK41606.1 hypothetical protein LAV01_04380 [Ligilactobacillus aviarius]
MNELVFKTTALSTAEPYTTSEVIAEYSENSHHAIQQLISKNKDNLEEFGILAFEMRKLKPGRGAKAKIYHLNEQQATFLITLLKNTPNVVAFKFELTRQFYATCKEYKNAIHYGLKIKVNAKL